MKKIGLIAGNRKFPILFAQAAKKKNCSIVAIAVKGDTSPKLKKFADKIYWIGIKDKKADTIFSAIAEKLEKRGFELLSSTLFLEGLLPQKGTLTKRKPNFSEWEDIYFGLGLAKAVAHLDIGQTIATKSQAIVAVEALEGTDRLIRRAGKNTRRGIVVVKVSRPNQDMRFDIPVVGLTTIKNLIRAKAACLVIEAEKTLFIDREASIQLADKKGISIVAA